MHGYIGGETTEALALTKFLSAHRNLVFHNRNSYILHLLVNCALTVLMSSAAPTWL